MTRTLGLEEELLLIDPETRAPVPASVRVLKRFHEHGRGQAEDRPASDDLDQELFQHQLEIRTDPTSDAADAFAQLVSARRTAVEAAEAAELAVVLSGTPPVSGPPSVVTPDDRYRDMVDTYGRIAQGAGTCGMHVHVEIASPDEGVAALDGLRPWLPVLLAATANSPFEGGSDTGYASWRAQSWGAWPSAGAAEPFGSVEAYRDVCRQLLETGAARDTGMLYFDARLAEAQPTAEVRICDVCTDASLAVTVAVVVRALVDTTIGQWRAGHASPSWRTELSRAAGWRASRYGLGDALVDPATAMLRPAPEVLDALVEHVRPALVAAGDLDLVQGWRERAVAASGAARQRAALEQAGDLDGVVDDLVARTRASCTDPEVALLSGHG